MQSKLGAQQVYNIEDLLMLQDGEERISPTIAFLALLNGMIGSLTILLPVLTLDGGYMAAILNILATGIVSFTCCYIYLMHLGEESDNGDTLMKHFGSNKRGRVAKNCYDIVACVSLLLTNMQYFQLIVMQWDELFVVLRPTVINPLFNGVFILIIVFLLKRLELGVSIMAYGLASTVIYLVFLAWVLYSEEKTDIVIQPFTDVLSATKIAAAMNQGFMILVFLVPVLRRNTSQQYSKITLLVYIAGIAIYVYIALVGSYGIRSRTYIYNNEQKSIEDYFSGQWQAIFIESIYLIHLYSVYPEFLFVGMKKFFSLLRIVPSVRQISWQQIVYIIIYVGITTLYTVFNRYINIVLVVNGTIICFFLIEVIPFVLHIKCMFFMPNRTPLNPIDEREHSLSSQRSITDGQSERQSKRKEEVRQSQIEIRFIKPEDKQDEEHRRVSEAEINAETSQQVYASASVRCDCNHSDRSLSFKILMTVLLVIMLIYGLQLMVFGLLVIFER